MLSNVNEIFYITFLKEKKRCLIYTILYAHILTIFAPDFHHILHMYIPLQISLYFHLALNVSHSLGETKLAYLDGSFASTKFLSTSLRNLIFKKVLNPLSSFLANRRQKVFLVSSMLLKDLYEKHTQSALVQVI